jgi:hypothetical protein
LRIQEDENVAVALTELAAGEEVLLSGRIGRSCPIAAPLEAYERFGRF